MTVVELEIAGQTLTSLAVAVGVLLLGLLLAVGIRRWWSAR